MKVLGEEPLLLIGEGSSDTIETEKFKLILFFCRNKVRFQKLNSQELSVCWFSLNFFQEQIGYVVIGDDPSKAKGFVEKWLQHFGLESQSCSIILHTDSEQYVRTLISSSSKEVHISCS